MTQVAPHNESATYRQVVLEIAEMVSADASELLAALVDKNSKFHKIMNIYKLAS